MTNESPDLDLTVNESASSTKYQMANPLKPWTKVPHKRYRLIDAQLIGTKIFHRIFPEAVY